MNLDNPHNKMRVLMITLLCLLAFSMVVTAQISKEEENTLIELYNATNGEEWTTTWNLKEKPSTWYGVKIVDDQVTEINLFRNNLTGILPESIAQLEHLNYLNLAFNSITGVLPKEMVQLKKLKVFKIEMNRIKGAIPQTIGTMKNLEEFTAFNNFLSGTIPDSFGELFENSLEGVIPTSMGNLTKLKELVLANNRLGGAIPAEIGQLASLEILQIQNNRFESFKNLEHVNTKSLLAFDYDEDSIKNDFKILKTGGPTRMADTKFEDDDNDDNK